MQLIVNSFHLNIKQSRLNMFKTMSSKRKNTVAWFFFLFFVSLLLSVSGFLLYLRGSNETFLKSPKSCQGDTCLVGSLLEQL